MYSHDGLQWGTVRSLGFARQQIVVRPDRFCTSPAFMPMYYLDPRLVALYKEPHEIGYLVSGTRIPLSAVTIWWWRYKDSLNQYVRL